MANKTRNHGYYETVVLAERGNTSLEKNTSNGEVATYGFGGYYILPAPKGHSEKELIRMFNACEF